MRRSRLWLGIVLLATLPCAAPGVNAQATVIQNGLVAEYRLTEGSGASVTDFSGHGANAAFPGGGSNPTWIANTGGLSFAGGQFVSLPASLNTAQTIQVFFSYQGTGDSNSFDGLLVGNGGGAVGNSIALLLAKSGALVPPANIRHVSSFSNGSFKNLSFDIFNGTGTISLVLTNGSPDQVYINGVQTTYTIANPPTSSFGLQTVGNYQLGGSAANSGPVSPTFFTGSIYYALFYSRPLTSSEIAANAAIVSAAMAARGVPMVAGVGSADVTNNVYLEGDSITYGEGTSPTWASSLSLSDTYTVTNNGQSSGQLAQILPNQLFLSSMVYHPRGGKNVVVLWAGSNDISVAGRTAAQVVGDIAAYGTAARSLGYKVLVGTMISRNGHDADKDALNPLIRQNWLNFADGLVDVASSPDLGADNAFSNANCFQTPAGIHPTTAAASGSSGNACTANRPTIATIVSNGINRLYGNTSFSTSTTVCTVATCNMTAADVYFRCDSTGGARTITLPDAIGMTTRTYAIKNIGTANSCTVQGVSPETIDGGTASVPAGATLVVESILCGLNCATPDATAGATWTKRQNN
jgi:hypothetical protein